MRNIAIIPARSGSKRLPDKNIRHLVGRPLMAYSIMAARESGLFEEIVVSTDSTEYADIAREWGASVPFLRSDERSTDTASSWDAVDEVLCGYRGLGREFDTFTLLQPTSPLRQAEDIEEAYALLERNCANAVVSVTPAEHPPWLSLALPEDNSLEAFAKELDQKHEKQYYRINGAIYIVKTGYFSATRNIYEKACFAYIMKQERSVDIDTRLDFETAAAILKYTEKMTTERNCYEQP